jgi:hypothetical protein
MKKAFAATLLAVAACGLLAGCGKKAEKDEKPAAAPPAPTPVIKTDWPQDQTLDAMLRGHPNSRKVCIDEKRANAFFVDYSHKEENDGFWGGWVFIQNVEFHETSNNTLFVTTMNHNLYIRAYPDVTGMKCKER